MSTLREFFSQETSGDVRYLLHAVPEDYSNVLYPSIPPVEVDVYFSNVAYMDRTSPKTAPFYYKPFDPRIITPLNITQSLFEPGKTGGAITPQRGTISLSNADGELDYLLGYSWDKKPISLYVMRTDNIKEPTDFADHVLIFEGVTLGVSANLGTIDIVVADFGTKLDVDFPPNNYAGTGGNEGSANLAGQPKPVTLGQVFNIPPVLVDESNNVYQVHDGAVTSIDEVYEGGESLTLTTDYTVDLANGRFTLTSTPTGIITADVTNDIDSGEPLSYPGVNRAGYIIKHIFENYAGMVDGTDFNRFFFRPPGPVNNTEHGAYFNIRITALDAVSLFANSIGASIFPRSIAGVPTGALGILVPEFPTTNPSSSSADAITDNEILDIEQLPTERYSGVEVLVGYKKNYQVLTEDQLSATPDDRDFVTREWRVSTAAMESQTWGLAYEGLRNISINTTAISSSDAATIATRLSTYHLRNANIYRVRLKMTVSYLEIGDAVELRSTRLNLTDSSGAGYPMLILSKFEDFEENEITLELMGEAS